RRVGRPLRVRLRPADARGRRQLPVSADAVGARPAARHGRGLRERLAGDELATLAVRDDPGRPGGRGRLALSSATGAAGCRDPFGRRGRVRARAGKVLRLRSGFYREQAARRSGRRYLAIVIPAVLGIAALSAVGLGAAFRRGDITATLLA